MFAILSPLVGEELNKEIIIGSVALQEEHMGARARKYMQQPKVFFIVVDIATTAKKKDEMSFCIGLIIMPAINK